MTIEDLQGISKPNKTTLLAPVAHNAQRLASVLMQLESYQTEEGKQKYTVDCGEKSFNGILHNVIEVQPPLDPEHLEDVTEMTLPNAELQIAV